MGSKLSAYGSRASTSSYEYLNLRARALQNWEVCPVLRLFLLLFPCWEKFCLRVRIFLLTRTVGIYAALSTVQFISFSHSLEFPDLLFVLAIVFGVFCSNEKNCFGTRTFWNGTASRNEQSPSSEVRLCTVSRSFLEEKVQVYTLLGVSGVN